MSTPNREHGAGPKAAVALGLPQLRYEAASPTARIWRLAQLERSDVVAVVVYSLSIGLLSLVVPLAAQVSVNTLVFTGLRQPIVLLALLVAVVLVSVAALTVLRYRVVERLKQRLFVRAAHEAAMRLSSADVDALRAHGPIATANYFFDVMTLQKTAAELLLAGLAAALGGAISLILLALYHPWLLAFGLITIAGVAFVIFGLGRTGTASAVKTSKAKHQVANWLVQLALARGAFKLGGAAPYAFERTDELVRKFLKARAAHFSTLMRQTTAAYLLAAFAMAALLGIGGALVIDGQLSLGQLVAAEVVLAGVIGGLHKLGGTLADWYEMAAALDKVAILAQLSSEGSAAGLVREPKTGGASLALQHVTVQYDAVAPALVDVSLTVAANEKVAIWGGDASGKSTLADLCWGARQPHTGQVLIDSIDMRTLGLAAVRADVALVGAAELFDGTVYDNIVLGRQSLSAETVAEVLQAAGLDADIQRLPEGIHTRLGAGGVRLTSSQAARLMIARALAGAPRLLVLDETLDGLSGAMVDRICAWLARPDFRCTVLVLTSRERVARSFSRFIALEQGHITAEVPV